MPDRDAPLRRPGAPAADVDVLDRPRRQEPNGRPSEPPEPIPDAASLRYAARAYSLETHSERDAKSWERIFAAEGADIHAAAQILESLRRNRGVPSLVWLFDFVDAELEEVRVDGDIAAAIAVARAFGAAVTRTERERLGCACATMIEHLDVKGAPRLSNLMFEVAVCLNGFVWAVRMEHSEHPVIGAELRGLVRALAEVHSYRSERRVALEAAGVAERIVRAFR